MNSAATIKRVYPGAFRNALINQQLTVLIMGVMGSLPSRFLAKDHQRVAHLHPNVRFLGADMRRQDEVVVERLASLGFPWFSSTPYMQVDKLDSALNGQHLSSNGGRVKIDGVVLAVPTVNHLPMATEWLNRGAVAWIDKPAGMCDQVPSFRRLFAQHSRRAMFVDFFLDSDAMLAMMMQLPELLQQIGPVTALHGRLVENWLVEKEPRPWLLKPEVSGGGLGIDQAVHQLAMMSPVLAALGHSLEEVVIDEAVMGRYKDTHQVETAFWCRGSVGEIDVLADCGKGMNSTYYGMTIVGERGEVEVFVGTEFCDPYLRVTIDGETTLTIFEKGQIGYGKTWLDFVACMARQPIDGYSLQQRADACLGAVSVVDKAYRLWERNGGEFALYNVGGALSVPYSVVGQVHPAVAQTKVSEWGM